MGMLLRRHHEVEETLPLKNDVKEETARQNTQEEATPKKRGGRPKKK